jgi:hypothetical protein
MDLWRGRDDAIPPTPLHYDQKLRGVAEVNLCGRNACIELG